MSSIENRLTELNTSVLRLCAAVETLISLLPPAVRSASNVVPIEEAPARRGPGRPKGSGKQPALASVSASEAPEVPADEFVQQDAPAPAPVQAPPAAPAPASAQVVMDYTTFKERLIALFEEGHSQDEAVALLKRPKGAGGLFGKEAFHALDPSDYAPMLDMVAALPRTGPVRSS
jgi:hypothetical protein